ncbi:OmpA family protein [Phaeobacter sp. QD34_3]|uniref:OmpA family protein n=1 Tax=unclassified Phaeobacter TaxID=2621772 RepID=UPI00237FBB02|nr:MULTISPECIES: OmpA family protein [unclassified Phaeobacter]MDE4134237.1 OmpA family protein [Phaeobacter sp. QD34_3]MDE4137979.1 OmpA family protein [Phaeobacter sp. QD34_24]
MRLSSLLIPTLSFAAAAGLSLVAASFAVTAVERGSEREVRRTLDVTGMHWAEVTADGLRVTLQGTAPDEATRFAAISLVGSVVDAARVIDDITVPPAAGLAPPRFSAEILRNDSGISISGLIPLSISREALVEDLQDLARKDSQKVRDLLEAADYPAPGEWEASMRFALEALALLPRAKISVTAGAVSITAIADSVAERSNFERQLARMAPPQIRINLDIAAPRPVITPFTLRFLISEDGAHFDACSAESEESRTRILAAARAAGLEGEATCVIGMGVPSPKWAEAAERSIQSLAALGQGSVTIANADITLVAAEGTPEAQFDKVVGELETALPQVFALHAVLPVPETAAAAGAPEFTATLSPEGQVQLRGRITDASTRTIADSYARARFGSDNVYTATRIAEGLPADWPVRVLAGLEVLSYLQRGAVTVTPDNLDLRGMSHREDAPAEIARFLSTKLGEAETYALDVTYEEPPAPEDQPMAPELCQAELAGVQMKAGKISFEPGSATVQADSGVILDQIAAILEECGPIRLEIQGHTDSQGREEMNQNLSQARAQSVLNELRARRILTSTYVARGYGESTPIAPNDTEEGREANRRIEFRLMLPTTGATESDQEETLLDSAAENPPATVDLEESPDEASPPEGPPEGVPEEDAPTDDDTQQETSDQ